MPELLLRGKPIGKCKGILFDKDGSIRQFGLGFKNKTIIPLWLVSIILGILAYFLVLYFISAPKLKYF